jgi:hypothetical protein
MPLICPRTRIGCPRPPASRPVCGAPAAHRISRHRFMESLKIYNTLAREKQTFVPIEPGRVRMYV